MRRSCPPHTLSLLACALAATVLARAALLMRTAVRLALLCGALVTLVALSACPGGSSTGIAYTPSSLLTPGRPERFDIDLWVTSNLFKRGHQIRLEVSSSNFPRFDRNPNSGLPFGTDEKMLAARQTIFHDRQHPSHLLLPIIPR